MMKINIVCDEAAGGWIYSKFIEKFKKHSIHEILVNSKDSFDVAHYLPYYNIPKKLPNLSTAWFSHMEQKEELKSKFITSAQKVNVAISHSKKYADLLSRMGVKNVIQIMPGVDLLKFVPSNYVVDNKSLVVGYVGRAYSSSNRKNPELLDKITKIKDIELKITGGKISEDKMPDFYNSVDLVISPSKIEGGPMAIQEALACGKPIVCFQSVGVVDEFNHGLIKIADFNEDNFIKAIEDWCDGKLVLNPPKASSVEKMRSQVLKYTWENFVNEHDKVWSKLCGQ